MVLSRWDKIMGVISLLLHTVVCEHNTETILKGMCPMIQGSKDVFCAAPVTDACNNDTNCEVGYKCCDNACGKQCINVTRLLVHEKPGICPAILDSNQVLCITPVSDECAGDIDCEGDNKCCQNPCGKYCAPPSKHLAASKPGICPAPLDPSTVFCARNSKDLCNHDGECIGSNKCCPNPCGRYCTTPLDPVRSPTQGDCPVAPKAEDIFCATPISHACNRDSDCREGLRCCDNPCGRYCAFSRRRPSLPLLSQGQCPVPPDPRVTLCALPIIHSCRSNADCDGARCCENPCGRYCAGSLDVAPIQKPGLCPLLVKRGPCRARINECESDMDCYGKRKCCRTRCGTTCISPKNSWYYEFRRIMV